MVTDETLKYKKMCNLIKNHCVKDNNKYFLGLITRCKDEFFVKEFCDYYISQGVCKIYILDDDSNDKSIYNAAIANFKQLKVIAGGGGKNTQRKKEIMGRTRCIYKKPNDRKEYVKYKGELVTLKEFKNNFKKKS